MTPGPFTGPLSDHLNYLSYIALENCVDYFRLVQNAKEKGISGKAIKYKRLRYFLNAIESLNNSLEYFFHDHKADEGWPDKDMKRILREMRQKHRILSDIQQIANAYKHCVRHNSKHYHASDLQSSVINIDIGQDGTNIKINYVSIEDERIMEEAFKFWVEYHNKPDKNVLLP